jgi:serine protease Do
VRGLGLPEVAFGDSRKLRVGAAVFAVGNPYGHGHTVTQGILSARARALGRERFDLFLQTDAAINPGNSGGPLFDSSGRVVGITTAIDGRGEALGFAMPIELVRGAMAFLERGEAVEPGWAGLSLHQGDDGTLRIAAVMPQSPAARAGLQVGDRIVSVDARTMLGRAAWAEAFEVTFPGERRTLVVDRSQRNETAEIVLEARSAWEKRIVPPPREVAAFGIAVRDLAPDVRYTLGIAGQQVVRADKGAPFATGDVLLAINGSVCDSPDAVIKAAEQAMQTRTFTADVLREGQRIRIARRW